MLAAEELVLGEIAHRGVGATEGVHLAEEIREAGRVRLTNLLEGVPAESRGLERRARVLEGGKGLDRPSGLREPSGDLDPVQPQWPRGLVPVRVTLADEDGGAGAEDAADLPSGGSEVLDVVNDEGEPRGVRRGVGQRQGACVSLERSDVRGIRSRIAADGSTARTLRSNQLLKAAANAPVPAPMSTSVIPGDGRR